MNVMFAMFNGWEIVLILALALILFGAKKLPELARGLGQGLREFKRSTREITDELESAADYDSPPPKSNRQRLNRDQQRAEHSEAHAEDDLSPTESESHAPPHEANAEAPSSTERKA